MIFKYLLVVLTCGLLHFDFALASSGDTDPSFKECVKICLLKECNKKFQFSLNLLQRDCKGDCQYECMFWVTNKRLEARLDVLQYYGKWPFYGVLGIQEPASFLFSIFNLCAQIMGWMYYKKYVPPTYEFYLVNKAQFVINSFGWTCAAIFHTRDTYLTEKMDYFSAALIICVSVFTCFAQIIGKLNDNRCYLIGAILFIVFGSHIFYMAAIHFDYGYNMKFLVFNGIINIVLWLIWCWKNRRMRPFVWKCALSMGGTLCLASLEIWDFPPLWWVFDGHSLWHLGTSPVTYLWFRFLTDNALYEIEKNMKIT